MATVLGTVISIDLETDVKKNGGGSYKGWQLVYKTQDGEVRNIAKPVQQLKFGTLKGQLSQLGTGDNFTLVQEKNDAGFYDVKSVSKGWLEGGDTSQDKAQPKATTSQAPVTRNTYETPEERALRQKSIVRQSSLSNAIAVLAVGSKAIDPNAVLELASNFEQWVNRVDYGIDKANPMDFDDDVPM